VNGIIVPIFTFIAGCKGWWWRFFLAYFRVQNILNELTMGCLLDGGLGLELLTIDPFLYVFFRGF
jgi:hypothetical protein